MVTDLIISIYRRLYRQFRAKKLSRRYLKFRANKNPFARQDILNILQGGSKKYKAEILQMLDTAVANQDAIKLQFCIAACFRDGLDEEYSDVFIKIILETWHEEHEDIVESISYLKDERFCEPLFKIAMNESTYRKFDDENEATLRKCVHALKAINTIKSQDLLNRLIKTGNPNVQYAMGMYK